MFPASSHLCPCTNVRQGQLSARVQLQYLLLIASTTLPIIIRIPHHALRACQRAFIWSATCVHHPWQQSAQCTVIRILMLKLLFPCRLPSLLRHLNPRAVVIMAGTNDVLAQSGGSWAWFHR